MSLFLKRLQEHAAAREAHPAVVTQEHEIGYGELHGRVEARLGAMRRQGIGPGAVAGITIADETEHLVTSLALAAAGADQIVLATHDTPALRARLVERAGVTHVVSAGGALESVAGRPARGPKALDGAALIFRTSGTTGDINLVAYSEEQIAAQAERQSEHAGERLLRLASIEHNNSKRQRLYCCWLGGTNVFRPALLDDVPGLCLSLGVTCLEIASMHASNLAGSPDASRLAGVKITCAGSAIPFAVRQGIERNVTPNLYVRYGATECGTICIARPGGHDPEEPVGPPAKGVVLQIVAPDGRVLPAGEPGEVRLRAAGMATGYLDNPADSAGRFREGWFYPGDVGHLRPDGTLVLQGRKDEMIILNGLNIFPAEIEQVLERHPAVKAAAALGLPSQVHGQIPVAAVELRPGARIEMAALQRFAREHLALRTPRRILALDRLPRNSQGKISRRMLASAFRPGRDGRD